MDSLTHTVLGACVGQVIAGKKIGKHAMFWGALANNIPDIDVITSFWMNQADSLLAHRGFTHSILFALLFSPLLAWIFKRFYKNKNMLFRDWLLIFGSGMFIHIFIDSLTCYGTGWFEPFNHKRVTMNILFVADPLYTIALFVAFIALLILKNKNKSREKWASWAIYLSSAYIVFAAFVKISIDKHFTAELKDKHIAYTNYFTTPAPLTSFLWYMVAKSDSGFYLGYHSLFDKSDTVPLRYHPQNDELISTLPPSNELLKLKRFSKNYYTAEKSGDTIYFNDIRFGTTGGWEKPNEDFVFRYRLNEGLNNDLVIQRGRMKSAGKEALTSLWERIKGN
jgi:inner membrane protein